MANFNRNRGFSRGAGKSNYKNKSKPSKPFDRDSRSFGSRPKLELHSATCAKCGNECEVPFRPNNRKPVFCRDCFQKDETGFGRNESPQARQDSSKKELSEINQKLDRILKILEED